MDFKIYQKDSQKTALYPNVGNNYTYPTLGLVSEAGEVAGKIKKVIRDKNGIMDEESRQAVKDELGDVLWYISQLATELKLDLEEIASSNIKKLLSRLERNVIAGSGDKR